MSMWVSIGKFFLDYVIEFYYIYCFKIIISLINIHPMIWNIAILCFISLASYGWCRILSHPPRLVSYVFLYTTADRFRNEFDNAVTAVENWVHDAILRAMDDVVIPRVEMAARSIAESSGRRPNNLVQNLDQSDFSGKREHTPLAEQI